MQRPDIRLTALISRWSTECRQSRHLHARQWQELEHVWFVVMARRPITGKLCAALSGGGVKGEPDSSALSNGPKLLRGGAKCRSRLEGFEHREY
jgi:hypothetical protein